MTDRYFYSHIRKPGRYLGSEFNAAIIDDSPKEVRAALLFPDLYEIGMSHQGLQILYHILNATGRHSAERCYCPDLDAERLLRNSGAPLCSLESGRPLTEFDLLGITLPYELCYTNILTMLDLATIPFFSRERGEDHPLLVGGGACAMNPEPVADFFDLILLGDGEEAIVEIADTFACAKSSGLSRVDLLAELARIDGVYIPGWFTPEYDSAGRLHTIRRTHDAADPIRRVLPNLEAMDHLLHPIVPNAKIVHDRLGIEVARGCTRGCRFCQAGITYRPVRERRPEQVLELADKGIGNSGFEELALLSLSTGDYSCLGEVLPKLMDRFADSYVSVAMPSMRVGTLTPEIMDQIRRVRKTGFTLAPEAGSERLRRVINKGISEEDLLATCSAAFSLGWKVLKCYFMIGLPTETDRDMEEIAQLIRKIQRECMGGGKKQITVSVGTFVPKPHTPFQWDGQLSIEESRERIFKLKSEMPTKGCSLKYHDPKTSFLEGVFSRGDRRLAQLLVAAWKEGARLDGWSDHFDLRIWEKAAQAISMDLDDYLRPRATEELLPWAHLQTGVDQQFLKDERQRASGEVYTPDCRYHGCQQCGLCDFDQILPVVHGDKEPGITPQRRDVQPAPDGGRHVVPAHEEPHIKYMVHYSRQGNVCFLGHLEILQLIFRGLRRAGIKTNFSKGFNPTPKVAFGPALPVGTVSLAEFFLMDLPAPLSDPSGTARTLSSNLPPGLEIIAIEHHSGKLPPDISTTYTLKLPHQITPALANAVRSFLAGDELLVTRERKGKKRRFNIRPIIPGLRQITDDTLEMTTIGKSGEPGIKPVEALGHILGLDEEALRATIVTKTGWQSLQED